MNRDEFRLETYLGYLLELVAHAHKACSAIEGLADPSDGFAKLHAVLAECSTAVAEYEAVLLTQEPGWIPVEKEEKDGN